MGVFDAVGNTPLVGIENINPNPNVRLYAKLEGNNPGGSVKEPHRAVHAAERRKRRTSNER